MELYQRYPKLPDFGYLKQRLEEHARLKYEYGSSSAAIEQALNDSYSAMANALETIKNLTEDAAMRACEPDALEDIRKLRPAASPKLWTIFDAAKYTDRLAGAFLGRMAGCTLGVPVEFWSVSDMREWAAYIGDPFPPTNYWSSMKNPNSLRYDVSIVQDYTRSGLRSVPVDDDVTYTLLGLLIAEDYGLDFTIEEAGHAWVKYLPRACTAEEIALKNLRAGVSGLQAADIDNPFVQWIGADIRSDPWGYIAPGQPEKAAGMAWKDAWLSHRRNGIYGAMYFSAVISAAFACDSPIEALRLGLNEIPSDCLLAQDIRWALETGTQLMGYEDAIKAVQERFGGMSPVHTNLNACLVIFGLMIGGDDFTHCISETVAMGFDNDCTAATVGSIFGASKGIGQIPSFWYEPFNNTVLTYINGHPSFAIDDVLKRFKTLAESTFN
ncbi:hypothetical protein AGMMS49992_21860 [Clostridia bacterium]|nr:hypothetical protein AGMMS49992_21860 [Clostridia bacterium]